MHHNMWQMSAHLKAPTYPDDASILHFVHKILDYAICKAASDIHFETYDKNYRVRFRIDGILHIALTPPPAMANRISSCIKIMSNLDIAERRLPQDGHFKLAFGEGTPNDFRVSTCPSRFGEKVVVRILGSSENTGTIPIGALGFNKKQKYDFLNALQKSHGLILVTGSTGSGKTTTLYSALTYLNRPELNIVTVEDPVEITVPGIHQVNIHPKIGLNFSNVIQAFLRQDPDIIMLGEMRCRESAEVAIQAAETGHLVLSTLHCRSAAGALTRLNHLGVLSFYLSSTLLLIVAQMLVRKLCEQCKIVQTDFTELELHFLKKALPENDTKPIYKAREMGCSHCQNGYQGRIGVFEVLPVTDKIAELILSNVAASRLCELAQREGMDTFHQSAIEKVILGVTSIAEVQRLSI